jgi:hypothetical protein
MTIQTIKNHCESPAQRCDCFELGTFKVVTLKSILKKGRLVVSGAKQQLVARLRTALDVDEVVESKDDMLDDLPSVEEPLIRTDADPDIFQDTDEEDEPGDEDSNVEELPEVDPDADEGGCGDDDDIDGDAETSGLQIDGIDEAVVEELLQGSSPIMDVNQTLGRGQRVRKERTFGFSFQMC